MDVAGLVAALAKALLPLLDAERRLSLAALCLAPGDLVASFSGGLD